MSRHAQMTMWAAIVVVSAAAGLLIAGIPDIGADDTPVVVDQGSTTSTSEVPGETTTTTSTTSSTTTSTTAPPARPRDQVAVLVANGTTVPGAASRTADDLTSAGWQVVGAVDGIPVEASEVWFTDTYALEAQELAEALGIPPDRILRLSEPPAIDPAGGNLIVLIGPDLAQ